MSPLPLASDGMGIMRSTNSRWCEPGSPPCTGGGPEKRGLFASFTLMEDTSVAGVDCLSPNPTHAPLRLE
jgi:hypothetical protein